MQTTAANTTGPSGKHRLAANSASEATTPNTNASGIAGPGWIGSLIFARIGQAARITPVQTVRPMKSGSEKTRKNTSPNAIVVYPFFM